MRISSFTVCIPVKDRITDLREAVASVFTQTRQPNEVIIVDDCSTVAVTLEQLPEPPAGISVRILRNDPNLGGARSLNRAVREASNSYIALLDSDDCFLPSYLEKIAAAWEHAEEGTVCVGTGFFWCTNDLTPYRMTLPPSTVTHQDLLIYGNIVGGSSILSVRREAFLAVGGYPECRGSFDWGLLLALSSSGTILTLSEPLVLYRSPSTNPKPNATRDHRKQLIAVHYIYGKQTPEDKLIMRPRIRKSYFGHLVLWGRRRMALRMLSSILYHDHKISKEQVRYLLIMLIGRSLYHRITLNYALLRAHFFGRKLLIENALDKSPH
jgi:glycosyltransferase involved in cell wall biosynthesis